jgi:hypothetical protein
MDQATRTAGRASTTRLLARTDDPALGDGRADDVAAIHRIFRATLVLGRPLPFHVPTIDAYAALCLDWYLEHGTVVLVDDADGVAGYLLACLDEAAHHRWLRRRAGGWTLRAIGAIACGRVRGDARRFVVARLRDGWSAWRHAPPSPFPAHAHVNLDPHLRAGAVGHHLAAEMDRLVADAGLEGWYGEMNVPEGRSLAAIERAGAIVVHRHPSRTFTWLLGRPVERATIARPLERAVRGRAA